jgi:hypothetical protein
MHNYEINQVSRCFNGVISNLGSTLSSDWMMNHDEKLITKDVERSGRALI